MIYTMCVSIGYKSECMNNCYSEQKVYLCDLKHIENQHEDHMWDRAYEIFEKIRAKIPKTKDIIDPRIKKTITAHFVFADIRCLTANDTSKISDASLSEPLLLTTYEIIFDQLEDFKRYSRAIISPEAPAYVFKAKFLRL